MFVYLTENVAKRTRTLKNLDINYKVNIILETIKFSILIKYRLTKKLQRIKQIKFNTYSEFHCLTTFKKKLI